MTEAYTSPIIFQAMSVFYSIILGVRWVWRVTRAKCGLFEHLLADTYIALFTDTRLAGDITVSQSKGERFFNMSGRWDESNRTITLRFIIDLMATSRRKMRRKISLFSTRMFGTAHNLAACDYNIRAANTSRQR